ncbi:MAG: flagellar hook-basal body protein [Mariprofundaceae bacterium]
MQRGFFVSGVAGTMAQQKLDTITHNLANVNTAGYRADRVSFSTIFTNQASPSGDVKQVPAAYLSMGDQYIDVHEGIMKTTENELDFAIHGPGYFRVMKEDGTEAYTRAGNFRLDEEGNLLTQGGLPVLDTSSAPITLTSGTISVTQEGSIYIDSDGSGTATASSVAELGIVTINDLTQIRKGDFTVIETAKENTSPADSDVSVHQGSLEGSNVNAVLAMTEMVAAMRSYQSMMKVVEQYNQLAGQVSERVGMVQG